MNAPPLGIYLQSALQPLAPFLAAADVTDIYVNRPGELWLERLGGTIERVAVPALAHAVLARLAQQVAAVTAQAVSREFPLLSASLPTGERVQIVLPPATRGDIAIAIRKHVVRDLALEDYRDAGAFSATAMPATTMTDGAAADRSARAGAADDPVALLRQAVLARRNILVSGGTSSGKTTFLNTLLREIPAQERLILIEDTPELQSSHDNVVGLIAVRGGQNGGQGNNQGEAQVSTDDLLGAALRMRPDRIILGEIRGPEAVTFLRAVNTGHPGSLSTIHADSPERAIDQLALLVLQTGLRMHWDDVVKYIERSIGVIVQLGRSNGRRAIERIYSVNPAR